MTRARSGLGVLLGVILLAANAAAQVTTADIVGRVSDSTGAVLPGVTVTVEHQGTHDVRAVPTNEGGDYAFNLLPIGTYQVKMELQGFGTLTSAVAVSAGDRARVDGKLQVGSVAETITVAGTAPLVQTDSSTVSSLVTEKAVQDLPVNGRNFVRLVQLVPGATEGVPNSLASGTRPDDRRQTSAISINGALDNQNNQLLDGIDNNERYIGTIVVKPSIDAIAEVKVQTNMYSAEVGRTAGGVVNIITKSGSNDLRGSAFEFNRNDRFDARNFFATSGPKPKLSQNQYGGSLGGPIKQNRTFFFADYEGFRSTQGVTFVSTVPTMKMRAGDFSELSTVIYDPTSAVRSPFAGNVIPSNRLDPIALKYMALYPAPTSAALANNFTFVNNRTQDSKTADVRIDHKINDRNTIFARYSWNDVDTFTPGALPEANGVQPGGNNGQFPGQNATKAHGLQTNYLKVWGPSLISEVRVGYMYGDIQSLPLNYGKNYSQAFGYRNANIDEITSALTPMAPAGYATLGDATFIPLITTNKALQISGSVTKTRGAHNFKAGAGLVARPHLRRELAARPKASRRARFTGLRCGSYSACHCTPSAKPFAPATLIASMVPSSARPSTTIRSPGSSMPWPCSELTRMVSAPSNRASTPPPVRCTSCRSAKMTAGSGCISPFSTRGARWFMRPGSSEISGCSVPPKATLISCRPRQTPNSGTPSSTHARASDSATPSRPSS